MSSLLRYYTEKPKVTRFPTSQSQSSTTSDRQAPRKTSVHWTDTSHESSALHDEPQQYESSVHNERPRYTQDTENYIPSNDFDEDGTELEPDARVWKTYVKETDQFDLDLVEGWNRSLDVILIFAALFSAISTAFVLESSKELKEDPVDSTAQTLETISQILLAIAQGNQSLVSQPPAAAGSTDNEKFTPSHAAICINVLWFLSLILSMAASLIAMLAKEWCYLFVSGRTGQPYLQARRRQQRWEGMVIWKMPELLMFLPSLMHWSLFLFAVGLSVYLWEMHFGVALPVIVVTLGILSVYVASTIAPFLHEFCPYSTATSRFIKGVYNTLLRAGPINGKKPPGQDIITSRALRWLIETCENPKSVDIALQAIAGADEQLPLGPLKECNVPSILSRRLTTGSPHTRNSESKLAFQLYARALGFFQTLAGNAAEPKGRVCTPGELRAKELDLHLTKQELPLTEDNLLALQIGTSAPSHCLRAWYIDPKNHTYELINTAVEFIEKNGLKDPTKLHNAARLSFVTGIQMLISCSLIHCDSSRAARFIFRIMEADIDSKHLGIFLAIFSLSRNDYPGWIIPSLDPVARATRAIDAAAFYIQKLDQINSNEDSDDEDADDEKADTLIDFGLLGLLSDPGSYDLLDDDFKQIRAMFIWVAHDPGTHIYTLPEGFDVRHHAMQVVSAKLKSIDGQQAIFKSDASVSTYLTALRQSYNREIGSPTEQVYVFVMECFFRAPSMFLEDCWALMADFPLPTLTDELAKTIKDRDILRLLLGALRSPAGDQQIFAAAQLALLIKLAVGCGKDLADNWKDILGAALQHETTSQPLEELRTFGEELGQMFRTIYEGDEQWSYYEYCSYIMELLS
ncbi:Anaphase-promoting complex subunit 2 [Saccharomyces cerevisiae S288c] [Rhizoctonia solani]|uniref:Anaphase-promoting complex subunit 2 [Saccharomyces cerevisiae S288c] n=1 Tax=Rhizoctonia solani TaxID=456999 RepID=A0A0K6FPW8_9AGAM|nr:Anaphase-promoting complex subunit 2 [Saccharomyces cerevisiae S288c] [Rhizoctonia solani]